MRYYEVDLREVVLGHGPSPFFVVALIEGLPDNSLTAALMSGGRDTYGWGIDRRMLADIYDILTLNTEVTGNWKKKPPKLPRWPRPNFRKKKDAVVKPKTISEVHSKLRLLQARGAGGD